MGFRRGEMQARRVGVSVYVVRHGVCRVTAHTGPKLFRSWPCAFHHWSCVCSLVLACHVINKGKCQSLPERLKIPGPKWRQLRPLNTNTSMHQTTTHCAELQMKYLDYINLHCVKNEVTIWLLSLHCHVLCLHYIVLCHFLYSISLLNWSPFLLTV